MAYEPMRRFWVDPSGVETEILQQCEAVQCAARAEIAALQNCGNVLNVRHQIEKKYDGALKDFLQVRFGPHADGHRLICVFQSKRDAAGNLFQALFIVGLIAFHRYSHRLVQDKDYKQGVLDGVAGTFQAAINNPATIPHSSEMLPILLHGGRLLSLNQGQCGAVFPAPRSTAAVTNNVNIRFLVGPAGAGKTVTGISVALEWMRHHPGELITIIVPPQLKEIVANEIEENARIQGIRNTTRVLTIDTLIDEMSNKVKASAGLTDDDLQKETLSRDDFYTYFQAELEKINRPEKIPQHKKRQPAAASTDSSLRNVDLDFVWSEYYFRFLPVFLEKARDDSAHEARVEDYLEFSNIPSYFSPTQQEKLFPLFLRFVTHELPRASYYDPVIRAFKLQQALLDCKRDLSWELINCMGRIIVDEALALHPILINFLIASMTRDGVFFGSGDFNQNTDYRPGGSEHVLRQLLSLTDEHHRAIPLDSLMERIEGNYRNSIYVALFANWLLSMQVKGPRAPMPEYEIDASKVLGNVCHQIIKFESPTQEIFERIRSNPNTVVIVPDCILVKKQEMLTRYFGVNVFSVSQARGREWDSAIAYGFSEVYESLFLEEANDHSPSFQQLKAVLFLLSTRPRVDLTFFDTRRPKGFLAHMLSEMAKLQGRDMPTEVAVPISESTYQDWFEVAKQYLNDYNNDPKSNRHLLEKVKNIFLENNTPFESLLRYLIFVEGLDIDQSITPSKQKQWASILTQFCHIATLLREQYTEVNKTEWNEYITRIFTLDLSFKSKKSRKTVTVASEEERAAILEQLAAELKAGVLVAEFQNKIEEALLPENGLNLYRIAQLQENIEAVLNSKTTESQKSDARMQCRNQVRRQLAYFFEHVIDPDRVQFQALGRFLDLKIRSMQVIYSTPPFDDEIFRDFKFDLEFCYSCDGNALPKLSVKYLHLVAEIAEKFYLNYEDDDFARLFEQDINRLIVFCQIRIVDFLEHTNLVKKFSGLLRRTLEKHVSGISEITPIREEHLTFFTTTSFQVDNEPEYYERCIQLLLTGPTCTEKNSAMAYCYLRLAAICLKKMNFLYALSFVYEGLALDPSHFYLSIVSADLQPLLSITDEALVRTSMTMYDRLKSNADGKLFYDSMKEVDRSITSLHKRLEMLNRFKTQEKVFKESYIELFTLLGEVGELNAFRLNEAEFEKIEMLSERMKESVDLLFNLQCNNPTLYLLRFISIVAPVYCSKTARFDSNTYKECSSLLESLDEDVLPMNSNFNFIFSEIAWSWSTAQVNCIAHFILADLCLRDLQIAHISLDGTVECKKTEKLHQMIMLGADNSSADYRNILIFCKKYQMLACNHMAHIYASLGKYTQECLEAVEKGMNALKTLSKWAAMGIVAAKMQAAGNRNGYDIPLAQIGLTTLLCLMEKNNDRYAIFHFINNFCATIPDFFIASDNGSGANGALSQYWHYREGVIDKRSLLENLNLFIAALTMHVTVSDCANPAIIRQFIACLERLCSEKAPSQGPRFADISESLTLSALLAERRRGLLPAPATAPKKPHGAQPAGGAPSSH